MQRTWELSICLPQVGCVCGTNTNVDYGEGILIMHHLDRLTACSMQMWEDGSAAKELVSRREALSRMREDVQAAQKVCVCVLCLCVLCAVHGWVCG